MRSDEDFVVSKDSFFIVDFSRYSDGWTRLGEGDSTPELPSDGLSGASPTALQKETPDEESPTAFIPHTWRDPAFELEVEQQVRRTFIMQAAEEKVRIIQQGRIELPPIYLLPEFLSQPDDLIRYAIEDLWPVGGNVLFAAPAKFGKSTTTMNLVRSLLDGTAFLDYFAVDPIKEGESILLVDLEMSESRIRSEIRAQEIAPELQHRLHVVPMRGLTSQLDLFNADTRKLWVTYCRDNNVRTLIIDPLAPLFGYLGVEENDNTAVNKFFQMLDEVKEEAGIRDLLVTHHCGHAADWRPRGASRFNDWPDALWLAKVDGEPTDPAAPRLFFARGRDVGDNLSGPGVLIRDEARRLTFKTDASEQQQITSDRGMIENMVFSRPGQVTRNLLEELRKIGVKRSTTDLLELIREMEAEGALHTHLGPGKGGPVLWYIGQHACPHCALEELDD